MTGESASFNVHIGRILLDRPESFDPGLVSAEISHALAESLGAPAASQRPVRSLGGRIGEAIAAQLDARGVSLERAAGPPAFIPQSTRPGGDDA